MNSIAKRISKIFLSIVLTLMFLAVFFIPSAKATIPINTVTFSAIKTDSATISWDSTSAGTSIIEYGTTTSYGFQTTDDSLAYFHVQTITGLSSGTAYHYRIRTKDYNGVETISIDYTFTTRTQAQLDAVIKAVRLDGALPKAYYVSTIGNDANNGLSTSAAFKTPSYAVSKADVGDTIYLMNETWNNQRIVFQKSGIDVAPITLTAYSGASPILYGNTAKTGLAINIAGHNYINISNFTIYNYGSTIKMCDQCDGGSYNTISNMILHDTGDIIIEMSNYGVSNNTFENSTLYNSGWNTIGISGHRYSDTPNTPSKNITIKGNKIYNSDAHSSIDMFGDLDNIIIKDNYIYNSTGNDVYYHSYYDIWNNIAVTNNTFDGMGKSVARYVEFCTDGNNDKILINGFVITNNTFKNQNPNQPAVRVCTAQNGIIKNNTYINSSVNQGALEIVANSHNITAINENMGSTERYLIDYGGDVVIQDPLGRKEIWLYYDSSKATVNFTDRTVFSVAKDGSSLASYTSPIQYSDKSSMVAVSGAAGSTTLTLTTYPLTATPSAGSATVSVNSFNTSLAKGGILVNFTANTTDGNNVTFTVSTLKPNTNYIIKRDGTDFLTVPSDSNGKISFSNSVWSLHAFTIIEGNPVIFPTPTLTPSPVPSFTPAPIKLADLNSDGIVNSVDFGILMSYWGSTAKPKADINQDGIVNSVDFGIMMSGWG